MPSGPADDVWSDFASRVSQSPFRAPSSNRDESCPLNLTPSRRFCDRWMTQGFLRRAAIRVTRNPMPLPLPVADAAGLTWPGLNPRIERLRVQRIGMASRQLGSHRAPRFLRPRRHDWLLRARMHDSGLVNDNFWFGFRFRVRGCDLASAISPGFKLNRHELRGRPKWLRRKHRPGEIQAEELVGTVLVRDSQTVPRQQRRANDRGENIFQDHSRPREIPKGGTTAYLGSVQRNSSELRASFRRDADEPGDRRPRGPIAGRWNRCHRET